MARPTRDPDGKRKQVAVRFGPQELARLDELAASASTADDKVSVGKLIESRVAALLAADDKTFALLVDIASGIAAAEDLMASVSDDRTRKPWHSDLHTWGAVAEMLGRGPIELRKPESAWQDTGFIGASAEQLRILRDKQALIEQLAIYGVSASVEPETELPSAYRPKTGLFGSAVRAAARYIDRRANEQKVIDAIEDVGARTKALELHGKLKELDNAAEAEANFIAETRRIYTDMEEVGRAHWRKDQFNQIMARVKASGPIFNNPRGKAG